MLYVPKGRMEDPVGSGARRFRCGLWAVSKVSSENFSEVKPSEKSGEPGQAGANLIKGSVAVASDRENGT